MTVLVLGFVFFISAFLLFVGISKHIYNELTPNEVSMKAFKIVTRIVRDNNKMIQRVFTPCQQRGVGNHAADALRRQMSSLVEDTPFVNRFGSDVFVLKDYYVVDIKLSVRRFGWSLKHKDYYVDFKLTPKTDSDACPFWIKCRPGKASESNLMCHTFAV